jgi:cytochrome c biogenesis protein CcmG, thiol:disulfide interchange protein DsbE
VKRWIQGIILTGLIVAILATILHNLRPVARAAVGETAPDFQLQTFDGKKVRLHDLRGKPLFLNFWASWCENCKDEAPDLNRAYEKFHSNVQFVGVDLAAGDQKEQALQFIQDYHVPYTILADQNGDVGDSYQVNELPTTYFIDKQGKIVSIYTGQLTADAIDQKLSELLDNE